MRGTGGSIKGSVLCSRLAFLRERRDGATLDRVLARVPPDRRVLLTRTILPSAWYPFDVCAALDQAIAEELGNPERTLKQLGEISATHNLGASHRVFVRDRDPHGLLRETAAIYALYYDTGLRTYTRVSDHGAILRTLDSVSFSRADCLTVVGWHEKAIAMCGGVEPRVTEHLCRARGDALCEYSCEWK